jgi:hypothetical protein
MMCSRASACCGGRDGADALRHGQAVLEQPVLVGLVVLLGGRSLAPAPPDPRVLGEEALQKPAQGRRLNGGDQRAQVGDHLGERGARPVEQIDRLVFAVLGRAQCAQRERGAVLLVDRVGAGGTYHAAGRGRSPEVVGALPADRFDGAGGIAELQLHERFAVALLAPDALADDEVCVDHLAVAEVSHEQLGLQWKRLHREARS